jgi:hypothetical protein
MQAAIAGAGCNAQVQAVRKWKRRFASCPCGSPKQGGAGAVKVVFLALGIAQSRTRLSVQS